MEGGRHLRVSLVVACLAHAFAFAAVRLAPPRPPAAPAAPDVEGTYLEIEPSVALAPDRAPSAPAPTAPADLPGALAHAARAGSAANPPRDGTAGSDSIAPAPASSDTLHVVTAPGDEGWSFHATNVDLGIDPRKRPLLAAGPGAGPSVGDSPAAGAPPASTTGGLAESLDAADVARGLGRGGVVSAAIHEAVQASSVMGTAIFAVTIDGAGAVSVRVSSASQDELGWARLNEAIRASVAARKDQIRMPAGAHGLRIAVQAEAKEQFPNGVKPKDLGTRGVAKGFSTTETKDKVDIHLPELAVVHHGKVCDVGLSAIPPFIAGGCDPSNIGAVAQRIVTSRVVSESRM
jgi:hypothetical protein